MSFCLCFWFKFEEIHHLDFKKRGFLNFVCVGECVQICVLKLFLFHLVLKLFLSPRWNQKHSFKKYLNTPSLFITKFSISVRKVCWKHTVSIALTLACPFWFFWKFLQMFKIFEFSVKNLNLDGNLQIFLWMVGVHTV